MSTHDDGFIPKGEDAWGAKYAGVRIPDRVKAVDVIF
jgi:hypothetical protein